MSLPKSYKNLALYVACVVAGAGVSTTAAVLYTRLPPLTTHQLVEPLNSAATEMPIALKGVSGLPQLLFKTNKQEQWAIVGGALLETGLTGLSVQALRRALAADPDNSMLHVALGEALTMESGGWITEEAKAEFDTALREDRNDLIARFYLAHWLLQNGKAKPALVKWVGLMRTVGNDKVWYDRLWQVMPEAADKLGISRLALEALCSAGM
jgi:cytochrome c-type biogenesis protein CcmH/NrfG